MTSKVLTTIIGLSIFWLSPSFGMSLLDYKSKVRKDSYKSHLLVQEKEAAKLEARSADLIFSPSFFANVQSLEDRALSNPPLLTYERFESSQASLGVQQQFKFGLQTKLSYQVSRTNYVDSPLSATTNLSFTDAKPVLELSMPLLKNGFGRSVRAQEEVIRFQSDAQQSLNTAQLTQLDIQAEIAYWRCAAAKEAVEVQVQSLKSAEGVKDYVSRKAKMDLGENSDVIQASALVEARKLQLAQAENEERAAALEFNSLLNVNSDQAPTKMDKLDPTKVINVTISAARPGNRADVVAAQAQMQALQSNAIMASENVRPSLDLYGSYAMNGRGDDASKASDDVYSANRDTKVIGVRFSMPLNLGAQDDVVKSAKLRSQAAATSYQKTVFEQDVAWTDLVRKLNEAKINLRLALSVEDIQGRKLDMEKKRLRQGRTTTYQVLLFEQDFLNAQLGRIQNSAQILALESQSKAFEIATTGTTSEGSSK